MASQTKHLLITVSFPEPELFVAALRQRLQAKVTWIQCLGSVPDESVYRDVDVLATMAVFPSSRAVCPNLKYVHILLAGTEAAEKSAIFGDENVRFTYSAGLQGPAMAEWAFMTYLNFEKKNAHWVDAHQNRQWDSATAGMALQTHSLLGQRVGILGYGSIGRQIGRVASAFGMEVFAFTASPRTTLESRKDRGYSPGGYGDPDGSIPSQWYSGLDKASLHHFLAQKLDLLVLSLPITDQTRGLLGKDEFALLSQGSPRGGAFLSNVARGDIVVQDDLIEALRAGHVRGAALDVTSPEPLPQDHPLWRAPNCFITPHISSVHSQVFARAMSILEKNLAETDRSKWINEIKPKI